LNLKAKTREKGETYEAKISRDANLQPEFEPKLSFRNQRPGISKNKSDFNVTQLKKEKSMFKISKPTVLTVLILVVICISSNSFGQVECKHTIKISGWGTYSDLYKPCDRWMKATTEFDVTQSGDYGAFGVGLNACEFVRYFSILSYPDEGHYVETDITYCEYMVNHQIFIDIITGPPGETRGFNNPELTVQYFASQPE
jgi:hypothetical protein